MMDTLLRSLNEHQTVMSHIENMLPLLQRAVNQIVSALQNGGKIFWMGNGGSAADAQHLAAELIGRFQRERRAIASLSLTTDTSILTCLSNDYDYSIIFSRQLEALCQPHDVVIGLSTSGNSQNVIKGIQAAQKIGAYTIGLAGHQGGELAQLVDLNLTVPSATTARIQEAHIFIGHSICEQVEHAIAEYDLAKQSITA
jgi:D-sedoheptulose 7-phosphate isomerase